MQSVETVDNVWYRNGIVWMVIAIPTLTVAGCMLTIYLAISTREVLVQDPTPDKSPGTSIPRDAIP